MENKIFIPKDKNLLDPKVDSTFKSLFTKEKEKSMNALKDFIGAVIGHVPKEVQVIENEPPKSIRDAKDIRLDLQCRMDDGDLINLEIQTCLGSENLRKRALYYAIRMMAAIPMKKEKYEELAKVYHVMITDFQLFSDNTKYLQRFSIRNDQEELVDNLQFIFIQLPLLNIDEVETENLPELEKWGIFFKVGNDIEKRDLLNRLMASSEGIREAGEVLMTISEDLTAWAQQEMRYKAQMDYKSGMNTAHDKGVEEGKAEGREEGIQIGVENTARGMKEENIPIETITKITGLTAEQVEAL